MANNKPHHFSVRLSEQSMKLLEANAERANLSKGAYLDRLISEKPLIVIDGLNKFIPHMKQSGKNLHQILVRLNTGQVFNPDVSQTKNLYSDILSELITIQRGDKA